MDQNHKNISRIDLTWSQFLFWYPIKKKLSEEEERWAIIGAELFSNVINDYLVTKRSVVLQTDPWHSFACRVWFCVVTVRRALADPPSTSGRKPHCHFIQLLQAKTLFIYLRLWLWTSYLLIRSWLPTASLYCSYRSANLIGRAEFRERLYLF